MDNIVKQYVFTLESDQKSETQASVEAAEERIIYFRFAICFPISRHQTRRLASLINSATVRFSTSKLGVTVRASFTADLEAGVICCLQIEFTKTH